MEKDFNEQISLSNNQTPQKDIMQRVNETYEQMVQDVRKIIEENDQASKLE